MATRESRGTNGTISLVLADGTQTAIPVGAKLQLINPFTYTGFHQTLLKQYPALADFGVDTKKEIDLNQWLVIADWIQDQGGEALAVFIRKLFGSLPVELLR